MGGPPQSLETKIASRTKNGNIGRAIALQKTAAKVAPSQDKATLDAHKKAQTMGEAMQLGRSTIDGAKQFYSIIIKEGLLKKKEKKKKRKEGWRYHHCSFTSYGL